MAFPWTRRDAIPEVTPGQRRRRGRGRRRPPAESRRDSTRLTDVRHKQRLLFGIGAGLVLVILGIIAFGYYQEFYKPPRVMAGEVNHVRFSMGDLVKRIRVLQGLSGQVNLSVIPFEYLQDLLNAEILRQKAPLLGLAPTDEEMEKLLRLRFYPEPPAGQQTDPGQLDREFKENYSRYLTRTGLSEQDYRVILKENIAFQKLRSWLGAGIENPQEQVEVSWIRLPVGGSLDPREVRKRLDKEEFAAVVADVAPASGSPDPFANDKGYVGWVPKQAFPELDELLFGKGEKQPLAAGGFSEPTYTREGIYIVRKLAGPEARELSNTMRLKLNFELAREWQDRQRTVGSEEGWVKINFNSKWYAWVAEQVRVSAPRTQATQEQ